MMVQWVIAVFTVTGNCYEATQKTTFNGSIPYVSGDEESASQRRLAYRPWPVVKEYTIQCNVTADCGANGKCNNKNGTKKCKCHEMFTTTDITKPCNTKQRSKTTARELHYFLGEVGAGAFYLGWTFWGLLSLICFLFTSAGTCAGCFFYLTGDPEENGNQELVQQGTGEENRKFANRPQIMLYLAIAVLIGTLSLTVLWVILLSWLIDKDKNYEARDADGLTLG